MIKPYDKLKVTLWDDVNNPNDISVGTIAIQIEEGVDYWEGDWQQPDSGLFTLVTRNTDLDPLINPSVKFNQRITFHTDEGSGIIDPLFIGYITDINVEYEPNGDSIITIQGTDLIGIFKRTLIDQNILDYFYLTNPEPLDFQGFLVGIQDYFIAELNIIFNTYFEFGEDTGGSLGIPFFNYRPAEYIPQIGESVLDIFIKYAKTNIDTISTRNTTNYPFSEMYIRAFLKYSPEFVNLMPDPLITYGSNRDFDSVNEPYHGYTKIKVAQNFDQIINQIYINNTSSAWNPVTEEVEYTNTNFDPFFKETSVQSSGFSELSLDLIMPQDKANTTEFTRYTRDIFEETAVLKFDVEEIEFNYLQRELAGYACGQVVRVTHRVSPTIVIDKIYKIAGIKHDINEYSWFTTYILKPSDAQRAYDHQQENNYGVATVQMNSLSGNTNFNFTATLTNFPVEMIDEVNWFVGNTALYDETGLVFEGARSGSIYKNNTPRTGNSITLNFDDDGILDFGFYGSGTNYFVAVITDVDGWTFFVRSDEVSVTSAQVVADFEWTRDAYNGYTFVNTSSPDVDTWSWDFGDGTTSTLANPPTHYYTTSGNKTVVLTVSNGITTDTHTEVVSSQYQRIPVKYIKATWTGTRTRANSSSPWNKNFITNLREIRPVITSGYLDLHPVNYVARVGSVKLSDGITDAPNPTKLLSDRNFGDKFTSQIKLRPLVTNSGNTEQFDIDLIMNISLVYSDSILVPYSAWDQPGYEERFKITDCWLYFSNFITGTTYETIPVSVSADGTNWYSIGNWSITPSSVSQGIWSLDNKPPVMPPIFPS